MNQSTFDTILAARQTVLRYEPGQPLFREGEQPVGVYLLNSGRVKLLFTGRNGTAKPLREALPRQILGVSSVVTRHPHECTAVAAETCEVAFIEREDFQRTLDGSPTAWLSVLNALSEEVNAVYDDMRALAAR